MKASQITNDAWYVFNATADFVSYGKNVSERRLRTGEKGYLKRNAHDPRYFQVVARLASGNIGGWYIREDVADVTCEVTVPAPKFAKPQRHWETFWSAQ